MKRQIIYPLLIAVLAAVLVTQAQAQTRENQVSEERVRRLLSGDGTANTAIQFKAGVVNRAQTRLINPRNEVSPNSSQELRALIFENYTPASPGGAALKATATPPVSRGSGTKELPSELPAEEPAQVVETAPQARTPPTQGDVKEAQ